MQASRGEVGAKRVRTKRPYLQNSASIQLYTAKNGNSNLSVNYLPPTPPVPPQEVKSTGLISSFAFSAASRFLIRCSTPTSTCLRKRCRSSCRRSSVFVVFFALRNRKSRFVENRPPCKCRSDYITPTEEEEWEGESNAKASMPPAGQASKPPPAGQASKH